MSAPVERLRDARKAATGMDMMVGYILFVGMLLSSAFLLAGIVWRWANTGRPTFDYTVSGMNLFQFLVSDFRQASSGAFRPRLMLNIGIALLLFLPYVRVAASMVYFAVVERDLKYTLFTGFVLLTLTYTLFLY